MLHGKLTVTERLQWRAAPEVLKVTELQLTPHIASLPMRIATASGEPDAEKQQSVTVVPYHVGLSIARHVRHSKYCSRKHGLWSLQDVFPCRSPYIEEHYIMPVLTYKVKAHGIFAKDSPSARFHRARRAVRCPATTAAVNQNFHIG